MHWIYILECENDYYYVGQTKRLYRKFWEHNNNIGCLNTKIYNNENIVAIYKLDTICKFIDYNEYVNKIIDDDCYQIYESIKLKKFNDEIQDVSFDKFYAQNNIVECLMIHNKNQWDKIRGGKYTRFDLNYEYPNNKYTKDLPLCKCGLPCDIKKNEDKNYLYFRCPKKNMWDGFKTLFDIYDDEPCNFFMEYTKDKKLKIIENELSYQKKNNLKELFKKSPWLENVEIYNDNICIGGCNRISKNIKLSYGNIKRNLCFDCFILKNKELSIKYNTFASGKCIITEE